MVTRLRVIRGKHDDVGGPITRLTGTYRLPATSSRGELMITDCKIVRRIKILPNIVRQVFSMAGAEIINACSGLDPTQDWHVYVKAKNGTRTEYSDVYKFPKDTKTHVRSNQSIVQIKRNKLREVSDRISELDNEINELNRYATSCASYARRFRSLGLTLFQNAAQSQANDATNEMADKAREREGLRQDLRQRERIYRRIFGITGKSQPKKNKK